MRPEAQPTSGYLRRCLVAGFIGIAGITGCQHTDKNSHDYSYPVPGDPSGEYLPYDQQPMPVTPTVPTAPAAPAEPVPESGDGLTVPAPQQESLFVPPADRRAGATLGDRISGFFRHPRQSSDRVAARGGEATLPPAHQMRSAGVSATSPRVTTGRHPDAWVADSSPGEVAVHARSRNNSLAGALGGHTPARPRTQPWLDDPASAELPADDIPNQEDSGDLVDEMGDVPLLAPPAPESTAGPRLVPVAPDDARPGDVNGLDLTPELESRRGRRSLFVPASGHGLGTNSVSAIPLWQASAVPANRQPSPTDLRLARVELADEVSDTGRTTPLTTAALAPGESALVVAWLENITARSAEEGLVSETVSQLEIRAWNGIVLARQNLGTARDVARQPRETYFLSHELIVPADLPTGAYRVTIRVTDKTTGVTAEASTDLEVAASN